MLALAVLIVTGLPTGFAVYTVKSHWSPVVGLAMGTILFGMYVVVGAALGTSFGWWG